MTKCKEKTGATEGKAYLVLEYLITCSISCLFGRIVPIEQNLPRFCIYPVFNVC